ncbi:hypothetical protein L0U85_04880 [Glycomyces sp. L485]|uniref:hypothetical protein n=1 Tax=Glycomyces sp. L485 TaxID=2909235 RepID=UPI001F4A5C15|nr:hypothetical protein [Glycomyces sp. L485]MCH7230198.1 hypothetical protein [Glycomyces sp. L485]
MRAFATDFPAFAALGESELLELIEENNTALAEAARGLVDAAEARFGSVCIRLGIADEVEPLTAALLGEIGDQS